MVDDKPMRIGWVFYFSYIFVAIIFHLFISFCYCLSIDMAEANTVVFFIKARDDFIIIFCFSLPGGSGPDCWQH